MKIIITTILLFVVCTIAKNVVNIETLASASESVPKKREAKNVVSLEELLEAILEDFCGMAKRRSGIDIRSWINGKRPIPQHPIQPAPLVQSIISQVPQVSIYSRYVRDDEPILAELGNPESFALFVAPSDLAVSAFSAALGLKPWEFPEPVKNDNTDEAVIGRNIDSFIKAHMSNEEPSILEDSTISGVLLSKKHFKVTKLEIDDSYTLIIDGELIKVSSVHLAGNGIVFVIERVLISVKSN